ncbi:uncharacterized protein BROUX77_000191 [Berkeleyomyces rouxiae]|uniref:uncharacterized protein n=1 Tax=Berkeleyomyces rouxiae TaxID=2035830 RepID=UPI003B7CC860
MNGNGKANASAGGGEETPVSDAELAQVGRRREDERVPDAIVYLEANLAEQTASAMEQNLDNLEKTLASLMDALEGASPGVVRRQEEHKRKQEAEQEEKKNAEGDQSG